MILGVLRVFMRVCVCACVRVGVGLFDSAGSRQSHTRQRALGRGGNEVGGFFFSVLKKARQSQR